MPGQRVLELKALCDRISGFKIFNVNPGGILSKNCLTDLLLLRFSKLMQLLAQRRTAVAQIATAKRAAFIAPGLPMASVATGIRPAFGRWPVTNQSVQGAAHWDAQYGQSCMGRQNAASCAAPPAAAITTSSPRDSQRLTQTPPPAKAIGARRSRGIHDRSQTSPASRSRGASCPSQTGYPRRGEFRIGAN